MIKANSVGTCAHVGILLTEDFSMLSFSSLIAPLRMANQLSGESLYHWSTLTIDDAPVTAGNGIKVTPDNHTSKIRHLDALIICAGDQIPYRGTQSYLELLQGMSSELVFGASGSGTYLLARAGLLDDYRCTIHWEHIAVTRERFPDLNITPRLFEIDRNRYTCAGGQAALDMILCEIRDTHGVELSSAITEQLVCDRQRDGKDNQSLMFNKSLYRAQPKLAEVISLMEANIEEPMTMTDLSSYTGLSKRQLERLFRKHMHCVPSRFYLQLRLEKARQLLLKTALPVSDIASECGFVSSPHFSKSYRDAFGLPPREDRSALKSSSIGFADHARPG